MESETCNKCGTEYPDPEEGFYWEDRKGGWRRPCKQCIKDYNNQPEQKAKRLAARKRYAQTLKGREAIKRTNANRMRKYYRKQDED